MIDLSFPAIHPSDIVYIDIEFVFCRSSNIMHDLDGALPLSPLGRFSTYENATTAIENDALGLDHFHVLSLQPQEENLCPAR